MVFIDVFWVAAGFGLSNVFRLSEGLAVFPIEVLIYIKLVARRRKDQVDVIELIKFGADLKRVRHYLEQYASDLVPFFEELLNEALAE